jgi:hypothetical protein
MGAIIEINIGSQGSKGLMGASLKDIISKSPVITKKKKKKAVKSPLKKALESTIPYKQKYEVETV